MSAGTDVIGIGRVEVIIGNVNHLSKTATYDYS
ncbi:MAG: hypothetical protein ACI8ZB_004692 [Desulforhopalus sp.]|jgi:hypothetical protein